MLNWMNFRLNTINVSWLEGHGLPEAGYPPLGRVLILCAEHEVLAARVTQAKHLVTSQAVVSIGVLKINKCLLENCSDVLFKTEVLRPELSGML